MTPASIGLALLTPLKRRAMSLNEGPINSDLASWQVKHCFALARAAGSAPMAGLANEPAQSINTIIVLFMWLHSVHRQRTTQCGEWPESPTFRLLVQPLHAPGGRCRGLRLLLAVSSCSAH